MSRTGRPSGAAGRAPRGGRSGVAQQRRSRAALPSRTPPRPRAVPTPRAALTARAAILAVALASVALALALPFKVWVGQRTQIHTLQQQTRAQEQRVAALRAQEQRWNDPAYVKQQARARLHYALPGESVYVVLGSKKAQHTTPKHVPGAATLSGPWYSRLWQSVQVAGKGTATTS